MKLIKSLILILSILVCDLSFSACGEDAHANPAETHVASNSPDSSKVTKTEQDSISMQAVQSVQTQAPDSTETAEHEAEGAKEQASDSNLLSIIALACAAIALGVAFWLMYQVKKLQERLGRHRQEIDNLGYKTKDNTLYTQGYQSSKSSKSSAEYSDLATRISSLEYAVKKMHSELNNKPKQQPKVDKNATIQTGYFGVPAQKSETEGYFKKLIEYASDPDVRFSAEIRDKHATFVPDTQLSFLKSSDTMKFAVNTTGCLLSEATSMQVATPGEAVYRDGRWEITKKACIILR